MMIATASSEAVSVSIRNVHGMGLASSGSSGQQRFFQTSRHPLPSAHSRDAVVRAVSDGLSTFLYRLAADHCKTGKTQGSHPAASRRQCVHISDRELYRHPGTWSLTSRSPKDRGLMPRLVRPTSSTTWKCPPSVAGRDRPALRDWLEARGHLLLSS